MSAHTPGPWRATPDGYVSSDAHGYVPIRTPFREDAFEGTRRSSHDDAELTANARLIAAAPDLLAGCIAALGVIHAEYANHPPTQGSVREAMILETKITLRRAIARAEGKV